MKRMLVFFIFFIMAAVLLSACSSTRWVRTPVVENPDFKLVLEALHEEGEMVRQTYAHPFEIAPSDLAKLMRDLTYTEEVGLLGKEKKMPVFQAAEIERLAPALADTLKTAADSQRIRFISYNRAKALIFSKDRKTEGVVFVGQDKQFNIAFNYINTEIRMDETTAFPEDFSRMDPLNINFSDTALLKTAPYLAHQIGESGDPAPLWMTADLQKLAATPAVMPAGQRPAVSGADKETAPTQTRRTEAAEAAPAAPASAEPAAPTTASPAQPLPAQPVFDDTVQQEIKTKLIYLKELKDDGLISEQDYNARKDQLLDKIQ